MDNRSIFMMSHMTLFAVTTKFQRLCIYFECVDFITFTSIPVAIRHNPETPISNYVNLYAFFIDKH